MAWWIFQNVVSTTVLAAVVAMICRYGRIGPVARHALWVLVLVKFITPPVLVWPWAAPDPFGLGTLAEHSIETPLVVTETTPAPIEDEPAALIASTSPVARVPVSEPSPSRPAVPWVLAVWMLGSACIVTIELLRIVRLRHRRRSMPAGHPIARRVQALAWQLGLRPISIELLDGISSPVIWGWGRPRLLWPSKLETIPDDASLDGIVVHELAHVKRGDHFVGWIELLAGVVWWWNPLFWSVRSARREQAELACDAWVISALPHGRRAYAESLLLLSGAVAPDPSPMTAVGIRPGSRRVLERRLVMIMKGHSSLRLPWVGLCSLALVAAATLPTWASASQQPPPPPPAPPIPVAVTQKTPTPPPPSPQRPQIKSEAIQRPYPPPPPPRPVVRKSEMTWTPKTLPPQVVKAVPRGTYTVHYRDAASLPDDGRALLEKFNADSRAIQEEIDQKLAARRDLAVKELEALQEKYTKEGKLDEAVAIRDFLRAGGPGAPYTRYTVTTKGGR